MRRTGFQLPTCVHQVASVLLYVAFTSAFYIFCGPLFPDKETRSAVLASYSVLALASLSFTALATGIDPTDYGGGKDHAGEDVAFCQSCQRHVHPRSRHCRKCDRCCAGFDHHCVWLNNCVGRRNYAAFLASVIATLAQGAALVASGGYLLAASFTRGSSMAPLLDAHLGGAIPLIGYRAVWLALAVSAAGFTLTLAHLLLFHLMMIARGTTTYDHITAARQSQADASRSPGLAASMRGPLGAWLLPTPRTPKVAPDCPRDGDPPTSNPPESAPCKGAQGANPAETIARHAQLRAPVNVAVTSVIGDDASGGLVAAYRRGSGDGGTPAAGVVSPVSRRGSLPSPAWGSGPRLTPRMSAKVMPTVDGPAMPGESDRAQPPG